VFAGSEFESYLRYLQTLGKSKPTTWSIRGFSPAEIDALAPTDSAHPWAARYTFHDSGNRGFRWSIVHPTVGFIFNSSFPWGSNDGVIWAGKGLTSWAQTGVAARWGPLSARLAPIAFRSENSAFPLWANGQTGLLQYADGQFPLVIDRPQRFGRGAYSRLDLGESELRADLLGLAGGISTASQWWGPTTVFPYILGNNAGGFPHVFFGTAKPVNVGIGRGHGRLVYGILNQSPFSPVRGKDYFQSFLLPGKNRFMAGIIALLQVAHAPGLEIGGARFFHSALDSAGIKASDLKLPIQNLLKNRLRNEGDTLFGDDRSLLQNQLASIFFRWAPPGTGVDIYGEYGREDFSADMRDFFLQPDHSSTQNFGFRKAWMNRGAMTAFRGEFFNYEGPASGRNRGEGLIYLHQPLLQGHTQRGQILGAAVGPGSGSAQIAAMDRYDHRGRMSAFLSRVSMAEVTWEHHAQASDTTIAKPADVQYSLGAEVSRFVGPFDITGKLVFTRELNRYLKNDAGNANFALTVRQAF
jgi:hypothetical protein